MDNFYTAKEAKVWIDKVKGKKLRWSGWDIEDYFIPNGEMELTKVNSRFEGIVHYNGSFETLCKYYYVNTGLESDLYGYRWIILYDWEAELESL